IMKKLISLLIGCSLALAGAALAQQPDEQQPPSKGKRAPQKAHAVQAQPGPNEAGPQERPAKQTGAVKERGATKERGAIKEQSATNERTATNEPGAEKGKKTHTGRESANAQETNVSGQPTTGASNEPRSGKNRKERATEQTATAPTTTGKQQTEQQRKGVKGPAATA